MSDTHSVSGSGFDSRRLRFVSYILQQLWALSVWCVNALLLLLKLKNLHGS